MSEICPACRERLLCAIEDAALKEALTERAGFAGYDATDPLQIPTRYGAIVVRPLTGIPCS